jgi:hypothetical protein
MFTYEWLLINKDQRENMLAPYKIIVQKVISNQHDSTSLGTDGKFSEFFLTV